MNQFFNIFLFQHYRQKLLLNPLCKNIFFILLFSQSIQFNCAPFGTLQEQLCYEDDSNFSFDDSIDSTFLFLDSIKLMGDTLNDVSLYIQPLKKKYPKNNISQNKLITTINKFIGTPYHYGGTGARGTDCSGFVYLVFKKIGISDFPRTSSAMLLKNSKRIKLIHALPGDLVFFTRKGRVFHVGIYVGNKRFAHASREKGVIYSQLTDKYYARYFSGIGRYNSLVSVTSKTKNHDTNTNRH